MRSPHGRGELGNQLLQQRHGPRGIAALLVLVGGQAHGLQPHLRRLVLAAAMRSNSAAAAMPRPACV